MEQDQDGNTEEKRGNAEKEGEEIDIMATPEEEIGGQHDRDTTGNPSEMEVNGDGGGGQTEETTSTPVTKETRHPNKSKNKKRSARTTKGTSPTKKAKSIQNTTIDSSLESPFPSLPTLPNIIESQIGGIAATAPSAVDKPDVVDGDGMGTLKRGVKRVASPKSRLEGEGGVKKRALGRRKEGLDRVVQDGLDLDRGGGESLKAMSGVEESLMEKSGGDERLKETSGGDKNFKETSGGEESFNENNGVGESLNEAMLSEEKGQQQLEIQDVNANDHTPNAIDNITEHVDTVKPLIERLEHAIQKTLETVQAQSEHFTNVDNDRRIFERTILSNLESITQQTTEREELEKRIQSLEMNEAGRVGDKGLLNKVYDQILMGDPKVETLDEFLSG
ncbi:hypothetical protein HDU76_002618 [Blyttiomyces sp. JEL0837]|nr:hypothetical protein HDU76_002618 [Blyttiomyces sp. JEL0837]